MLYFESKQTRLTGVFDFEKASITSRIDFDPNLGVDWVQLQLSLIVF